MATRLLQALVVAAAILAAVGAFGPWGALSSVPEQADVVARTRVVIAVLVLVAGAAALVPWQPARIAAALAFAAVAIVAFGEVRYEGNQAWQHGVRGARWGLHLALGASLAGLLACVLLLRRGARAS